ncbi:DNA/RNA non-specific endonuclease [Flavobacterium nitratireducens]|uniref:DNA/RNA non-specific endonuclease n=1 Tax=Flavobacterium nitratireducens TaxID=992289 RepID=UPI0024153C51|nr:DNA/RNA non-specific endonuclease [Flavobacterium nitratireducens]
MNTKFGIILGAFVMLLLACKQNEVLQIELFGKSNKIEVDFKTQSHLPTNSDIDYLPKATQSQIVYHHYFTLSYNEKAEQAEWVAYELKKDYIKRSDFKRPFFIQDPKVKTQSADWRNYKKSGYDKGHLCPAADMEFDLDAYNDTFYTSNISPQQPEFNSGIWNRIEQKMRFWAVKFDGLFIVTGGVLKGNKRTIGTEKVVVPNYFYKIALNHSNGNYKLIAFLVPNEKSTRSIFDYVVSVDEIESLTGIDFFPKLDDQIENRLEKIVAIDSWLRK